ncbi:MAG: hypothetical protein A2V93_00825 [Ignavibacteria bacterium RBG_16_34_14]|nr:MAG: hypothetical protein A2V93_00825 [Ignavibacteria bacterium RBG_16_34_14]
MRKYIVPDTIAISDSGFLFMPSTGETFNLNKIGKEIFQMLQKGGTEEEVFKYILDEYDIDKSSFEKDFSDFVAQLQKYTLIKEE